MIRAILRAVALVGAISLVAVACGGTAPSPSASSSASPSSSTPASGGPSASPSASADLDEIYAAINEQVRQIRGLEEQKPVTPRIVSSDELAQVISESFDTDYPPEAVAADERLYKGLGLIPESSDLKAIYVDLLESQVAGLYDPIKEELYVLSKEGGVGPVERVYYAHEYDHALQDQNFDLEKIQGELQGESDQLLARQSLIEGDAYVTMTIWLQSHLTPAEIGAVIQSSSDPELLAALDRIPPIVQSQIMFSATEGTTFVLGLQLEEGWGAVDAAYSEPPASTEQILHPEKYRSGEEPVDVTLPEDLASSMGSGWSVLTENTFGEHQTSIWLGGPTVAAAADGAAGWGGDRIVVLGGPDGTWAIAWHTVWDTADDADEFEAAATTAVAEAGGPGSILPGEGGTTRWVVVGSSDAVHERTANVLGLAG
jgi:hypothetical protein